VNAAGVVFLDQEAAIAPWPALRIRMLHAHTPGGRECPGVPPRDRTGAGHGRLDSARHGGL